MAGMFKLQLSCLQPDQIEVRVLESSAGEPHQAMRPPFDALGTQAVLGLLEIPDASVLAPAEFAAAQRLGLVDDAGRLFAPEELNTKIGRRLYDALFPGSRDRDADILGAFNATLDEARRTGRPAALQLRFDSDAVRLAGLPWELICDASGQAPVAEGWISLTRYITFGQTVAPLPVSDCLEVLVITPRPVDAPDLGDDRERVAIQNAFIQLGSGPRLRVDALNPPTYNALISCINTRPYHVVHFDGHGEFAARCGHCGRFRAPSEPACLNRECPAYGAAEAPAQVEGCLVFERDAHDRTADPVGAKQLAAVLANRQVHLFVASACRSATVGGDSVFTGVGPRLILAGVPAVVAMQFSVPADSTAGFVAEFYAALARGDSIASAAGSGRKTLYKSGVWFTPAVYLRSRDGEGYLYRYQPWAYVPARDGGGQALAQQGLRRGGQTLRPRDAAPYKFLSPFEIRDESIFFGREDETQRLVEEALARPVVVLSGPPGVGKTSLLNAGLSHALLGRDFVVLIVREYAGEPLEQVRRAISATPALNIDPGQGDDLRDVLGDVMRATGRPVAVIFDAFERFLAEAQPAQREAFAGQIAACVTSFALGRCCLILGVREDWVGSLPRLLPGLPDVLHAILPLGALGPDQARRAITGPLAQHDPPLQYESGFLEQILLPALVDAREQTVNPTHLQIVCQELYDRARVAKAAVIDIGLCPEGGIKQILKDYLEKALNRLAPEQRDLARTLMKPMVSAAGERVFVEAAGLAAGACASPGEVQTVLDALLGDGLLDPRTGADGLLTYSLGHALLAAEVRSWFDPEEAQRRCAESDLRHVWGDWHGQWSVAPGRAALAPLASSEELRRIRAVRDRIDITPEQLCLLLRSAVHAGCDTDYWAHELAACEAARELVKGIEAGPAPGAGRAARQTVEVCAGALGLDTALVGNRGLARGAVSAGDRHARHAAALALASLGLDAVDGAVEALQSAAPVGRGHRRPQALARMRVAGFRLPALPLGLTARVGAWEAAIRLWDGRWRLAAEGLGAGLGGGALLLLFMALAYIPVALDRSLITSEYVIPLVAVYLLLGGLAGLGFAVGRWCLDVLATGRVARVAGGSLGFAVALLALWPMGSPAQQSRLPLQAALGLVAGAAIAFGWEIGPGPRRWPRAARSALGGAAGGALAFAAAWLLSVPLPLGLAAEVDQFSGIADAGVRAAVVDAVAALTGAILGAGMAGGGTAGRELWVRYLELAQSPGAPLAGSVRRGP